MTDPRITRIEARQKAQTAAARLTIAPVVAAGDAATEAQVVGLFDVFTVGKAYKVGDMCAHAGKVWRCVQAHTSQADWTPDKVPALWTTQRPKDPVAWTQPLGAQDAYRKGDRVTYKGATYESLIDANTWAPDAYPAGWKKV